VDVSITQPSGVAHRAAARATDGAAVARREREKRQKYGRLQPTGNPFIPVSAETFSLLGKLGISCLGHRGTDAEEAGHKVIKPCFVSAAIRELSVGSCSGNNQMYRASLYLLAGVSGHGFREGAGRPTEEVL
jgi:RNA 3'-terminal phosphate cyclase